MSDTDLLVRGRILSFDLGITPFSEMFVSNGKVQNLSQTPLPYNGRVLDLSELWVVPAFIDSHVHILELGLQFIFPDLTPADSLAAAFELIAERAQLAWEHGLLLGFNLDPGNTAERRMPTRKELDRILADRPMLIYRIDGHSATLNSRALDLVFAETGLEEGLELDRYREPTGQVRGIAYEKASRWFKRRLSRELKLQAFDLAAANTARRGVLTIGALVGSDEPDDDGPELLVQHAPRLPVQVVVYPQTLNIRRAQHLGLPRIGGCLLIDGSFGSHTAALRDDYADQPGNRGRLYFRDEELFHFLQAADRAGLQITVHAIGDRAIEQVVRGHELIANIPTQCARSANPLRHRIEHAELLSPELISRIARLGLILGVQPAFEHYWGGPGRMYEQRLGSRYRSTNPYRELIDAGVVLAGGSDAPITPVDPKLGINTAASLPVPEHNITRLDACRLFTDRAAYALGIDHLKGSLAPGCDADFVVLSHNPLYHLDFSVVSIFRSAVEL